MPQRVPAHPDQAAIDEVLQALFPLNRSLTGRGNRATLDLLGELIPLVVHEYPTGTKVYDWTIPKEWTANAAWIKSPDGKLLVNWSRNNVHLVGYSSPVCGMFTLAELRKHLHWREDMPAAIPYRTSYYKESWGFCISYDQYQQDFAPHGDDARFEVRIDTELLPGSLSVGELLIPGELKDEVLLSTYFCHPSLGNDNLSGTVLTAFLAKALLRKRTRYSYRVLFVPETIGAVAYCAHNETAMQAIDEGFVITCVAGQGPWGYKASFNADHRVNRVVEETFAEFGLPVLRYGFDPHGSDERQYASPGFRINTASICKDKYYEYPEYHTSLDNLDFISAEALAQSLTLYLAAIDKLEAQEFYRSANPHCEVMLSPRGLYPDGGGGMMPGHNSGAQLDAILWLMMLMDGHTSVQDAAHRTGMNAADLHDMAEFLCKQGLLTRLRGPAAKRLG